MDAKHARKAARTELGRERPELVVELEAAVLE
jgi:hypothetical protein